MLVDRGVGNVSSWKPRELYCLRSGICNFLVAFLEEVKLFVELCQAGLPTEANRTVKENGT